MAAEIGNANTSQIYSNGIIKCTVFSVMQNKRLNLILILYDMQHLVAGVLCSAFLNDLTEAINAFLIIG